jgi:phosphate starvation-inducible PhoH-like protein
MMNAETIDRQFPGQEDILLFGNSGKPIRARTPNQRKLVEKAKEDDLIFAIGPAGSGKTYTAIALAVRALKNREIKRIILSRPAVEAGENLGFLPGDLKEKIDPYLQPLYDALLDMIPPRKLEEFLKDGVIQIAPLAFMRGRTLSNAYVILDEAQNTSIPQLKMFLTRMGLNTKYVITGDITQIDLPKKQPSGLITALRILKDLEGISIIEFDKGDIIRHRLVRDIVEAYDRYDKSK